MNIEDIKKCPVRKTLSIIGKKWTFVIIMELQETRRFGELKSRIPDISEKILIDRLKTLAENNIIVRKDYKEVPPRVEYRLTKTGKELSEVIPILGKIGKKI